MHNLGILYKRQGRYAEAEALNLQTLETQTRVLGEEHPSTLGTILSLGSLYCSMERFEEAAEMLEVSLPIKRRVLGLQHPWTSNAMNLLVMAYTALGRTEDALPLQRELFGLQVAAATAVDANARVLNNVAWDLLTIEDESLRDPEQGLGFAKRACALAEEAGSDRLWGYLDTLALAQHQAGDIAAAALSQRRAIALMPEGADPGMAERLAEYEAALRDQ